MYSVFTRSPRARGVSWRVVAACLAAIAITVAGVSQAYGDTPLPPLKIVVLGDSYSAGTGARNAQGPRDYYGPEGCQRAHSAWSEQYAASLRSTGRTVSLVNRACSGATTNDVLNDRYMDSSTIVANIPHLGGVKDDNATLVAGLQASGQCVTHDATDELYRPIVQHALYLWNDSAQVMFECQRWMRAQIASVDARTDLVLMMIGGNDIGFDSIVQQCFVIALRSPGGCHDRVDDAKAKMTAVQAGIEQILTQSNARLNAKGRVAVISYPYLEVDPGFTLDNYLTGTHFDAGRQIRAMGDLGDVMERTAVSAANRQSGRDFARFVDTTKQVFADHEPNAEVFVTNPNRWMYEVFDSEQLAEWYHPNLRGHVALRDIVQDAQLLQGSAVAVH
jgi:lysophospholipase L1-like esterase